MTLKLLHSEFPYIGGKFDFFFIIAGRTEKDTLPPPHPYPLWGAGK
jgi:hypothetical protein